MASATEYGKDQIPWELHAFGATAAANRVPLFLMPVGGDPAEMIEGLHLRLDRILKKGDAQPFYLAVFKVADWNGALSPWPAPAMRRDEEDFLGDAPSTLDWVLKHLIPGAEESAPCVRGGARGMLGYSMAGLFALWAAYQVDAFEVCATCSGALWYEGFVEYIEAHSPKTLCSIYLSLGTKEEKVRNPHFAKVGDATRSIASSVASASNVRDSEMVWHPGGHFGMTGERLSAAILWMLRHV